VAQAFLCDGDGSGGKNHTGKNACTTKFLFLRRREDFWAAIAQKLNG
jgi:hypothetical protein